MCCAGNYNTENNVDGQCDNCQRPTVKGNALEECEYSPTECETCNYSPCTGDC